jgi:hypothetical protein
MYFYPEEAMDNYFSQLGQYQMRIADQEASLKSIKKLEKKIRKNK